MGLVDIPAELFIIIMKKLDLKSQYNMYNTCQYSRQVLCLHNVVKDWQMSMSSMATVKYLKSNFFKDIAGHLQELNLCGVVDLRKTSMVQALRRLKNLKTLDVSYTNLNLYDFEDMYKACKTIKNICINFEFEKHSVYEQSKRIIEKYQNIFKNIDNVHFIGSTSNLMYSNLVLHLLGKSNLNILKLSVIHRKIGYPLVFDEEFEELVKFNEFYVYFMNLEANYGHFDTASLFQGIHNDSYEKIIIVNAASLDAIVVYATPIFKEFFKHNFNINALNITEYDNYLTGNIGIMIFNKATVQFDTVFFNRLLNRVKDYFPNVFATEFQENPVPNKYDWFYSYPHVIADSVPKNDQDTPVFKKRRIANPNYVMNYDTIFKDRDKVKLTLTFSDNYVNPVTVSPNSEFLSKLTFLSLSGTVRYSLEFFNVLFRCCNKLVTLDVLAPPISPCISPIARSIPLSKTLKNFRLIDRRFDYSTFFLSLSQCKTLENIHILDQSSEYTSLADPSILFANCENLYSICIKACMTDSVKDKVTRLFKDVRIARGRPQINVDICQILLTNDIYGLNYEPFLDVLKIFAVTPGSSFA